MVLNVDVETTVSQLTNANPNEIVLIIGIALGMIAWWIICNFDKLKRPYEWLMKWHKDLSHKEELIHMIEEDHEEMAKLENEVEGLHNIVDTYNQNRINDRAQSFKYQESWMETQKKRDVQIDAILSQVQEISRQVAELSQEVKINREYSDRTRIKEIRSRILDFANSLPNTERSIDELEEIFDLDEEYITLLEKYGEKNGRTTRAMDLIKEYYNRIRGID